MSNLEDKIKNAQDSKEYYKELSKLALEKIEELKMALTNSQNKLRAMRMKRDELLDLERSAND